MAWARFLGVPGHIESFILIMDAPGRLIVAEAMAENQEFGEEHPRHSARDSEDKRERLSSHRGSNPVVTALPPDF